MATVDSNIALGVKPIQIENPINRYAAMSQIESSQQARQLNALKMRQAQQEFDTSNALANAYKGAVTPEGAVNYNLLIPQLASSGAGSAIPGVLKTKKETEQAAATLEKTQTETKAEKLKLIREKTADLVNNPSPENIKAHAQDGLIQGAWDQAQADAFVQKALSIPINQRAAYFKEQSLNAEKRVTTAETYRHNTKTEGIQQQQVNISAGNLAVSQQRLKAELDSTGALTPQAIDVAAQIYLQTGQLPALGIGKSAGSLKSAILNRATELYGNPNAKPVGVVNQSSSAVNPPTPFNASDMATQIVGNKIDNASKTKAAKDFSTGTQGRQVTAFNTAIDHLATMEKLSDALKNNDVKAFNYLGNLVAKQTGQPAPTNFDAAKQIVTAEVIKAVVASGGGVKERQEAEANFSGANSPAQLKGVINTYKQLLGGQLNSLGLQYETTTGRTDFNKKLTSDAKTEYENIRNKNTTSNTGLPPGVGTDWTLKTDAKGNKAYVSPDNSKFVEVK